VPLAKVARTRERASGSGGDAAAAGRDTQAGSTATGSGTRVGVARVGHCACPGARPGIRGGNGPGAARLYPGQAPRQARTPARQKQPTCRDRPGTELTVESGFIRSHMGTGVPGGPRWEPAFLAGTSAPISTPPRREATREPMCPSWLPIGNLRSPRQDEGRLQPCPCSGAHPLHLLERDGANLTGGLAG
jgi:hypothetical protein